MKPWQKFLLQIQGTTYYDAIIFAIEKIIKQDFKDLDIQKIKGSNDLWRIRIGKYRILYKKNISGIEIIKIGEREGFYN